MRANGLRKWAFICVVGACVTIGVLCVLRYSSNDAGRADRSRQSEIVPGRSKPPAGAGAPKTGMVQEIAALKTEEMALVQAVMKDFPKNVTALEQRGNFSSRHGQRTEAAAFWQKCLAVDPRHFNAHRNLGMVALDKAEYEQALEHYRTAAGIRPEAKGIHGKMGEALVGLGRYDEAIRQLKEEMRISPRKATAHFLLGQAYLKQKAYEKAQAHYEKALELNPKYANACYGLARVFMVLKQPEKAGEYQAKFRTFRAEMNQNAYDRREMGTVDYLASARASVAQALIDAEKLYRDRKDFSRSEALLKRAVVQFERMSEIQPNNPRSYLNIGNISTRLGRFGQAERAYKKAIVVAPRESVGYRKLSQLYLRKNTVVAPRESAEYRSLSQLYLKKNTKLAEARTFAQKAVDLDGSAENLFVLGWACDVNGDRAEAAKAVERAIRLNPKNLKYRQVYERIKRGY